MISNQLIDNVGKIAGDLSTTDSEHRKMAIDSEVDNNGGIETHNTDISSKPASTTVYNGGWRPFAGWVCGLSLAYHFLILPLLLFVSTAVGVDMSALPPFDIATLVTVLAGLLGMGGLRSWDKAKGTAAK